MAHKENIKNHLKTNKDKINKINFLSKKKKKINLGPKSHATSLIIDDRPIASTSEFIFSSDDQQIPMEEGREHENPSDCRVGISFTLRRTNWKLRANTKPKVIPLAYRTRMLLC